MSSSWAFCFSQLSFSDELLCIIVVDDDVLKKLEVCFVNCRIIQYCWCKSTVHRMSIDFHQATSSFTSNSGDSFQQKATIIVPNYKLSKHCLYLISHSLLHPLLKLLRLVKFFMFLKMNFTQTWILNTVGKLYICFWTRLYLSFLFL